LTNQDYYINNAGILLERTTDPDEAFLLWCIDGASILITARTDRERLLETIHSIFDNRIAFSLPPGMVATSHTGEEGYDDPSSRTVLRDASSRLDAHTDGARGFSDEYPDLLTLLCAQQAASEGESFLVDGQYLCDTIARDPEHRQLARFLWGVPIEQCRPMGDTPPESPNYLRSQTPVASRTPGGRPTIRYHPQPTSPRRLPGPGPPGHY
jgi:Taurine catabolism dioxygenase TauD, TfdA family